MIKQARHVLLRIDTEYNDILRCIWDYYYSTGEYPTIAHVAGAMTQLSLDDVMRGLRAAEKDGWIALHLEEDREIEVFRFLTKAFRLHSSEAE